MATAILVDSIQNARTLKHAHTAAVEAGEVLVNNGMVLVAVNKKAADEANAWIYRGKVQFPKEAALAISVGDKVYWDNTNGVITKTATSNTQCGYCVEAAAGADANVIIMLEPVTRFQA